MKMLKRLIIIVLVWMWWLSPISSFGMPTLEQVRSRNLFTVEQLVQFERQAKNGNSFSQVFLGEAYRVGGIGTVPNEQKAIYWFEKAAKRGNPIAEQRLSLMYLQGTLVKRDAEQYKVYAKKAYNGLELLIRTRQGSSELMAFAEYCLGSMYFWGIEGIVPQDLKRSFELTKDSAEFGYLFAIHRIIIMYRFGIGVAQDAVAAFSWSLIPAKLGDREAQYIVGMAYLTGNGVQIDNQKAIEWLSVSAKQGYYQAVKELLELKKRGIINGISEIDSRNWTNIFDEARQGQYLFLEERMEGRE